VLNVKKLALSTLLLSVTFSLSAYSATTSIDAVLKQADLMTLIGTDEVVNLVAQFRDQNASTDNVNNFDNFVAIGVLPSPVTHINSADFDASQTVLKETKRMGSWIGVANFKQNEIPELSLQDGLIALQACMQRHRNPTPTNRVTNVTLYKTLNTAQVVYDYAFVDPALPKGSCQEYLYLPSAKYCEEGTVTSCHLNIVTLGKTPVV